MAWPILAGLALGAFQHLDNRDKYKSKGGIAGLESAYGPLLGTSGELGERPDAISTIAGGGLMGANVGMAIDANKANNQLKSAFSKSLKGGSKAPIPPTGTSSFPQAPVNSQPFTGGGTPVGSSMFGGEMNKYGEKINMSSFKDPYADIPFDANAGAMDYQSLYKDPRFLSAQMGGASPIPQSSLMSRFGNWR